MTEKTFDLIIIGGGPGGYVAAIRGAQHGLKVALVEKEHLGGICLNWGCIPTKALLRSSELYHVANHAADYGLKVEKVGFDLEKIVKRSRQVSGQLSAGVKHLMKKNKVTVLNGYGRLNGNNTVSIDKKETINGKHIILATGARARVLPGLEPDGERIWSYREAMVPTEMPKKLLVIGSGAIGIEFASFYNALGVDVTVVEMMDRVLPVEDADISTHARERFEKMGMTIMTEAKVAKVDKTKSGITAHIEVKGKTEKHEFSHVISAVGVIGNTEDLGLEKTKVKVERNAIVVDEYLRTGEPGVYAIGDVVSPPWLAHKASHEGIVCVDKILGKNNVHPINRLNIPGCTYCHPQVASVGLTEQAAKDAGHSVKVGKFPFIGNGKAIALGEPEGLVKTIFDAKTGELLGAHMIGAEVTELIQGFVIGKTMEATEEDFMHTIFPHPTLSEMMHESVLMAYGQAVHF